MLTNRRTLTFLIATSLLLGPACGDSDGGGASSGGETAAGGMNGSGGDTGSGATGGSGTGGSAAPPPAIGSPCEVDADCGMGAALCITADTSEPVFGGGSPPGGYCSAACETNLECPTGSRCIFADSFDSSGDEAKVGRCLATCELGSPPYKDETDALSPRKCGGRSDLRCATVSEEGICLPTCGGDADCAAGRFCDPSTGACTDREPTGLPIGAACEHGNDDCAGGCILFNDGSSMCSAPCVLGGGIDEASAECGGLAFGLCAFAPGGSGVGDGGFCTNSCSSHADCESPGFWCFNSTIASPTSGAGYCFAAKACPGGDADCAASEQSCFDTADGPLCLSEQYSSELQPYIVPPRE